MKTYRYKLTEMRAFIPFATLAMVAVAAMIFATFVQFSKHPGNGWLPYAIDGGFLVLIITGFAFYKISRRPVLMDECGIGCVRLSGQIEMLPWNAIARVERILLNGEDKKNKSYLVCVFSSDKPGRRAIQIEDSIKHYFALMETLNEKIAAFDIPAFDVRGVNRSGAVAVKQFDRFAA